MMIHPKTVVSIQLPQVQPSPTNIQRRVERPCAPKESDVCCASSEGPLGGAVSLEGFKESDSHGVSDYANASFPQVSTDGRELKRSLKAEDVRPHPGLSRFLASRPKSRFQESLPPPLPTLCSMYPLHPAFLLTRSLSRGVLKNAASSSMASLSVAPRDRARLRRHSRVPERRPSSACLQASNASAYIPRPSSAGMRRQQTRRAALPSSQRSESCYDVTADAQRFAQKILTAQFLKSRFVKRKKLQKSEDATLPVETCTEEGWDLKEREANSLHSSKRCEEEGSFLVAEGFSSRPQLPQISPGCRNAKTLLTSPSGRQYALLQQQHETLFGPLFKAVQTAGEEAGCVVAVKAVKKDRVDALLDGRNKTSSTEVAKLSSPESLLHLIPETPLAEVFFAPLMEGLHHVHCILEVFEDEKAHYVVSRWAEGGDLLELLKLVTDSSFPDAEACQTRSSPGTNSTLSAAGTFAEEFLTSTWRRAASFALHSLSCASGSKGHETEACEASGPSSPPDSPVPHPLKALDNLKEQESTTTVSEAMLRIPAFKGFSRGMAGGVKEEVGKKLLFQALLGLVSLHLRGVALQDFSLENCLLFVEPSPETIEASSEASALSPSHDWLVQVRVCDPGQAVCFSTKLSPKCRCGASAFASTEGLRCFCPGSVEAQTVFAGSFGKSFRPPESFPLSTDRQTGLPYLASRVDSWCFGWSAFYLLTGVALFERAEPPSFLAGLREDARSDKVFRPACRRWKLLRSGHAKEVWQELGLDDGSRVSPLFLNLIEGLLREEGRDRLSLVEALSHPWFNSLKASKNGCEVRLEELPELYRHLLTSAAVTPKSAESQISNLDFSFSSKLRIDFPCLSVPQRLSRIPVEYSLGGALMKRLCRPGRPSFTLVLRGKSDAAVRLAPVSFPRLQLRQTRASSLDKQVLSAKPEAHFDYASREGGPPPSASVETSASSKSLEGESGLSEKDKALPHRNACGRDSGFELKLVESLQNEQQQRQRRELEDLKARRMQALERQRLVQDFSPPLSRSSLPTKRSFTAWGSVGDVSCSAPKSARDSPSSFLPKSLELPLQSRAALLSSGTVSSFSLTDLSSERASVGERFSVAQSLARSDRSSRDPLRCISFSPPSGRLSLPASLWREETMTNSSLSKRSASLERSSETGASHSASELSSCRKTRACTRRQTAPSRGNLVRSSPSLNSKSSQKCVDGSNIADSQGPQQKQKQQPGVTRGAAFLNSSFPRDVSSGLSVGKRRSCAERLPPITASRLHLPEYFSIATPSVSASSSKQLIHSPSDSGLLDSFCGGPPSDCGSLDLSVLKAEETQRTEEKRVAGAFRISVKPLVAASSPVRPSSASDESVAHASPDAIGEKTPEDPLSLKDKPRGGCTYSPQGPQRAAARAERRRLKRDSAKDAFLLEVSSPPAKPQRASKANLSTERRVGGEAPGSGSTKRRPLRQSRPPTSEVQSKGRSASALRVRRLLDSRRVALSSKSPISNKTRGESSGDSGASGRSLFSDLSSSSLEWKSDVSKREAPSSGSSLAERETAGVANKSFRLEREEPLPQLASSKDATTAPLAPCPAASGKVRSVSPGWAFASNTATGLHAVAHPVAVIASTRLNGRATLGAHLRPLGGATRLRQLSPAIAQVPPFPAYQGVGKEQAKTAALKGEALQQRTYRQLLQHQLFIQQQFVRQLTQQQRRVLVQPPPVMMAAARLQPSPVPSSQSNL